MNPTEILASLSEMILADSEISESFSDDLRESGWLGYPPCSERDILTAEERLGVSLPPSLRQFYSLTNGWRNISFFVDAILPIEKIDFLPTVDPELTEVINSSAQYRESYAKMTGIELDEDPQYIDEQVTRVIRSIVLSTEGDATTTLIDPHSDVGNGEWNVGAWASWHPAMNWANTDWWSYLSLKLDG